jgi:hypothetical protein
MDTTIRRWFAVVSAARAKNCFDALQEALQAIEPLRIVQRRCPLESFIT